jgi:hypothetical protein
MSHGADNDDLSVCCASNRYLVGSIFEFRAHQIFVSRTANE